MASGGPIQPSAVTVPQGLEDLRTAVNESLRPFGEHYAKRLPPGRSYSAKDEHIPVDGGEIKLRCLVPAPPSEGPEVTYPVLVWFHGAGWSFGTLEMDDNHLRTICVDLQLVVVNVDYRLAPEHPFPTGPDDCFCALKWVAANASSLRVDLEKGFVVGGDSAGGNLAAAVVLQARDDPIFSVTPITGQFLREPTVVHPAALPERFKGELRSMEEHKDADILTTDIVLASYERYGAAPFTDPRASPLLAKSHAGLPRTYIQVMEADPLRDHGLLYERVLCEAGGETRLDRYPGVPHSFYYLQPSVPMAEKRDEDERNGLRWLLRVGK